MINNILNYPLIKLSFNIYKPVIASKWGGSYYGSDSKFDNPTRRITWFLVPKKRVSWYCLIQRISKFFSFVESKGILILLGDFSNKLHKISIFYIINTNLILNPKLIFLFQLKSNNYHKILNLVDYLNILMILQLTLY